MPEIGTSGLMSGDGKRGGAKTSMPALILDSTCRSNQRITILSGITKPSWPPSIRKYWNEMPLGAKSESQTQFAAWTRTTRGG